MFYVYKWYVESTGEVFYIGKGTKDRYKETTRRNRVFKDEYLYKYNDCKVEIVQKFESEEEAFKAEAKLIAEYKAKGQAKANLDDGGKGGCNFVWTDEMRQYYSEHNVMKRPEQRQRMSENNPMKNPEVAKKVGLAHSLAVIIDGKEFVSLKEASNYFNVSGVTITNWCKKGINPKGQICQYKNGHGRKPCTIKVKNQKAVIVDEKYFPSIKEAASNFDFSACYLGEVLRKGKTNCKGHKCRYADQQPSQENVDKSILEGSTTNE